jgi:hypothetical protein
MKELNMEKNFHGPLRYNPVNPRYFTDDTGRAVYLTGSHTWANLMEIKLGTEPDFDYAAFLQMLAEHDHNAFRLWTWDHAEWGPWTEQKVYFEPLPFQRTGPGLALDGKPKYDLGMYNPDYFERLRRRVIQAGELGMYVSVMLFEGWCVKWSYPASDAWPSHPYNRYNNVNGVDGDPDNDEKADIYSLEVPEVVDRQLAYIRQVIDTVNDLDNVLYEIINEIPDDERGVRWHYHMIDYIHKYEATRPKRHPVGMTAEGGNQDNSILFASPADWISPGRGPGEAYKYDPPAGDGSKVILTDTDHLWGHGGNYLWAWKSFLRGLNPLFMDPWGPVPGRTRPGYADDRLNARAFPDWEPLRANLGATRRYAARLDLNRALPHGELASSHYCLAEPGRAYLVYVPQDAQVAVDLSATQGSLALEWYSPRSGKTVQDKPVWGGDRRRLVSPLGIDVVLFLQALER